LRWEIHDIEGDEAVASLAERVAPLTAASGSSSIYHELKFVQSGALEPSPRLRVCLLTDGCSVAGLAFLRDEPAELAFRIGPATVGTVAIRRFAMNVAPLFSGELSPAQCEAYAGALADTVCSELPRGSAVMLRSLELSSPITRYVAGEILPRAKRGFRAVRHGRRHRHYRIALPGSFDDYLRPMTKANRRDVKKTLRKFDAAAAGQWRVRCYTAADEVPSFYGQAAEIAQKSWQSTRLGVGVNDRPGIERAFERIARLGWFRSYVLFANDVPIAFQIGFVYKGVYYLKVTGFDPAYAKLHVGVVLLLEILKDLIANDVAPRGVDFGTGENLLKARLSNQSTQEAYYYLFPRTARGAILSAALGTANGLSSVGAKISGRWQGSTAKVGSGSRPTASPSDRSRAGDESTVGDQSDLARPRPGGSCTEAAP
jgi:CelD/BcsL family acetyltransferase involved in cellulose biosynthesis